MGRRLTAQRRRSRGYRPAGCDGGSGLEGLCDRRRLRLPSGLGPPGASGQLPGQGTPAVEAGQEPVQDEQNFSTVKNLLDESSLMDLGIIDRHVLEESIRPSETSMPPTLISQLINTALFLRNAPSVTTAS